MRLVAVGFLVLLRHLALRVSEVRAQRWAEGRAHGRAEAHQLRREWNARRLEAEQRHERLTERPPR